MNFQPTSFSPKKSLLLPFLLLLPMLFQAQVAMKYVPAETPILLTVNLGNLDKKVNLAQLTQYEFYNEMVKDLSKSGMGDSLQTAYFTELMVSPENLGFDVLEPFHFSVNKEGSYTYFTTVIKLANRAKYEERLQNLKLDAYPANLKNKNGYLIWQGGGDTYAWNDEVVVMVWSEHTPPPFDWSQLETDTFFEPEITFDPSLEGEEPGDPSEDELEEPIEPIELEVTVENPEDWQQVENQAAVAAWVEKIMRRQFPQPMTGNERFRSAAAQPADVHFWLDYEFLTKEMGANYNQMAGMSGMGWMQGLTGFYEKLLANAYLSLRLNFENGKMALTQEMFVSDDMKKLYQGMFKAKFNKKFLRYVEGGEELYGYAFFNISVKNTIEEGKALAHKLFNSMPGFGQMADDAMKIAGIFIDEQAIGNLLKGDLLLAVSGMQTRMVRQTSYDLDENFNVVPKDTLIERTLPVFTALASYGNGKDIQKFIDLGLHSQALQPDGRFYKFTLPDSSMDIYLAMHDGILLFTNDRDLVQSRLDAGVRNRLSKKHRKLLCQNSTAFYWDIPNTLRAAGGGTPDSNVGMAGYLNMMGNQFESLQMTSSKKVENSVKTDMSFNFVKKDVNALEQFFRFVNELYVEMIGGAKT